MARDRLLRRIAERVYGERGSRFWSRIDIIGDIAVIRKPFDAEVEELIPLAEELLRSIPYLRSVWAAVSGVDGDYRLRDGGLVHLAGERRTETLYREHGCAFKVDIARVYISPRLSYEHDRVARLVEPGETVVNMYAGAGLFSVIMACRKPVTVYSIDINPYAYRYMVENVEMNRLRGRVVPILGDASRVVPDLLEGVAARILMPLPERALEHLPSALRGLRGGRGVLHVYLHVATPRGVDPRREAAQRLLGRLRELGVEARVLGVRVVRTVGPRRSQVVVDALVEG